jgi:hypothetical protein
VLLAGIPASAQTTSVSGTIVDQNSQAWAFGTIQLVFRPSNSNPTAQYYQNGVPFNKNTTVPSSGVPLALDSTGSFSGLAVPDNNTITPSGSTFNVTVCPAATTPCVTQSLTITGATQNISASIVPPASILNLSVPLLGARAYADTEVTGALPGTQYFNLTDNRIHVCIQTGFPPCTWFVENGGAGTVTSVSGLTPLFSVSNPTTTPTFALLNAAAGTIYGNPSGSSGPPSFNAPSAFSGLGTVTSVSSGNFSPLFNVTVSTPTTTPAFSFAAISQTANLVFASPNGSSGSPLFRALVGADLPNPSASTLGGIESKTCAANQFVDLISTVGVVTCAQPTASGISGLGFTQFEVFTFCASGCTVTGTPCSTGSGSNAECTNAITWPTAFADTGYSPHCSGVGTITGFPFIPFLAKTSESVITVTTSNGQNNAAVVSSFGEIDCEAGHP